LAKLHDALARARHNRSRFIIVQTTTEVHSFDNRVDADQAVQALSKAGFDMRKVSLLGKSHHGDQHTLRERSSGEHVRSWASVGLVWGALVGLLAPVPADGLAATQGYLLATLIHTLAGALVIGGVGVAVGAMTRPGTGTGAGVSGGHPAAQESDTYRLVIRGSADDHAQARRVLDMDRPPVRTHATDGTLASVRPSLPSTGASVHPFQPVGRPASRRHVDAVERHNGMSRQSVEGSRRSG
jgi:hypothetical protein